MDKLIPSSLDRQIFGNDLLDSDWLEPANNYITDTFKIDVKEDENAYTVEAEVPGVDKSDIRIELEDGHLVIAVAESKNENIYVHRERRMRSMSRSIFFANASQDDIKAKIECGLLEIIVPKRV